MASRMQLTITGLLHIVGARPQLDCKDGKTDGENLFTSSLYVGGK